MKIFTLLFTLAGIILHAQQPGDLDLTFGDQGFTHTTETNMGFARAMAIQPDDKIVVAGGTGNFGVMRFLADGGIDQSFGVNAGLTQIDLGTDHYVYATLVQPDGKILVAGYANDGMNQKDFAIIRLTTDGWLDEDFSDDGMLIFSFGSQEDECRAIELQPDGKIVLTGYAFSGMNKDLALARLNPDGSFDTTFSTDGKLTLDLLGADDIPTCIAVQPDGKIVVGGYFYNTSSLYCTYGAVRFKASGDIDNSFGNNGIVTIDISSHNDMAQDIAIQSDGKIVLAGQSDGTNVDYSAVRLLPNGALDTTFNTDGKFTTPIGSGSDYGRSVAVQNDGKILIGGSVRMGSFEDVGIVRLTPDGNLDTTFSTDGKINTPVVNGISIFNIALQSNGKIIAVGGSAGYRMFAARYLTTTSGLGIETRDAATFSFYPNPAKSHIQFSSEVSDVSIYDANGRTVLQDYAAEHLDISGLAKGFYFMRATIGGKIAGKKLVVE